MFGGSRGFAQDTHEPMESRPAKRPRNISGPAEHGYRDAGPSMPPADVPMQLPPQRLDIQVVPPATASKPRGEDKNNRKLSCKECRSATVTFLSCVKRGCGSLCPEGALTSGRGSRFILANTEQLHEKIGQLSDRVRQLEDALQSLQSQVSPHPHPLLTPELLKIKTSQELYGATASAPTQPSGSGMATQDPNAHARDDRLRDSVGAMSLEQRSGPTSNAMDLDHRRDTTPPEVPPDILQLSATFPFPWQMDLKIRKRIRDSLPPRDEARAICEEARRNALWQYNLDSSETFIPNLVHYCYTTPIEDLSPRRLALLLMVLSIGSLVDLSRPLGSLHGEAYHHLARAAVCEIPLMEEPDFDVLHALFFMMWYHLIFSDNKKAIGYAWNLMGFVAKLAQGLVTDRDSPRLKLIPEEHEKRRAVFWELLNMDCRMSLSLGRPPSICLAHVDVQQPTYVGPGIYVPKEEVVYHEWKHGFFIKCLSPMLEVMIAKEQPDYSRIIELDTSVRDFGIPALLDVDSSKSMEVAPRFLCMQRAMVALSREIALLQLHRKYFTQAMSDPAAFDLHHQYAPSVIATYLAASGLISTVETLFDQEQQLTARFLHFWFNSFSASVTLSLLISRAPSTPLAHYALQSLERVCQLFRRAAVILPFAGKALPVMQKLIEKSRKALLHHQPSSMYPSSSTSPAEMGTSYTRHSEPRPLPTPFKRAHPFLIGKVETILSSMAASGSSATTPPTTSTSSLNRILDRGPPPPEPPTRRSNSLPPPESWLPDIYKFSSLGLGLEDRYNFASSQPTPFTPSSPRVAENKDFNFDHGDITVELVEETSYMAWF
ncbi:hypothetical protein CC1G_05035 [Coprinopsis cinerea okayama7|uniref:Xylanolytic transcriptional activator regulatory domain-containing protein n=1 Tax=Coprinopsis cinerea (strain Okayama-7 / 130 / ATCC MYA-4618 / FGSC 9003) TaxID=240176 RepID=A8NSM2_COPC7|nr:hypothetical protein CC1G_05035 [Coprinopsis cinerea okayama7\|eukprot:XP_001836042.2 hypothetical protein CC1G_05035 [Coprinopsis cinerea okayama7\